MNGKTDKKSTGIIVALCLAILLGVVVLVIAVMSLVGSGDNKPTKEESSRYVLTEPQSTEAETTKSLAELMGSGSAGESSAIIQGDNQSGGTVGNGQSESRVPASTGNASAGMTDPVKYYESLQKNGDNVLSDYHDNKYIKKISLKYNVSPELLVAIYSQPDTGNNFVLQFTGKRDSDGNVVKSPDTLEKLYLIDKEGDVSVATGKTTGNEGVSYAEGTLSFYMVKTIVMPQYPDYFDGV